MVSPVPTEPEKDKIHVITEATIYDVSIDKEPNAFGYTLEVVNQRPNRKVIRGARPRLVIYDEIQQEPRQEGEPP